MRLEIDSEQITGIDITDVELIDGLYGIKWSVCDYNDEGERCFDAVNKKSQIGIGNKKGYSDFDVIYPWSRIQRCCISTNSEGEDSIVYEGESGFSLDGSSGDVFVRIPKFCVDKYQRDGFQYLVISKEGDNIHPAFIEGDRILDEIFVSAFEGWYDMNSNTLRSIGGVIPSSNLYGNEFLTSAQNKGINYTLYDNRTVDAIYSLIAVEFGRRNTNHIFGYGYSNYWQPILDTDGTIVEKMNNTNVVSIPLLSFYLKTHMPIGSNITICKGTQTNVIAQRTVTDIVDDVFKHKSYIWFNGDPIDVDEDCFIGSAACSTNFCETCGDKSNLIWHSGRADFIKNSNTQNPIRYRWIENLWGSLWHFLPDVTFSNGDAYVCSSMIDYSFCSIDEPYKILKGGLPFNLDNGSKGDVVGKNYWVSSFDDSLARLGIPFGNSFNKELQSVNAFGAYYYLSPERVSIVNGGGFDHLYRCNILTQRAWVDDKTKWYLYGARLLYKPLSKHDEV